MADFYVGQLSRVKAALSARFSTLRLVVWGFEASHATLRMPLADTQEQVGSTLSIAWSFEQAIELDLFRGE